MFYVSRKVGRKYGVIDTNDGIEEFYTIKALKEFIDNGVQIRGVEYIHKRLVITPISIVENRNSAAKNRVVSGTSTGIDGFDLKFEGDKVIALPLTDKFFEYAERNSKNGGFVLNIPDMVTHLSDKFFNPRNSSHYNTNYSVILPSSLVEIGVSALSSHLISSISINSNIARVCSGGISGSLRLSRNILRNGVFHVRCLEKDSLFLHSIQYLNLPDIEYLSEGAINFNNYRDNLIVHLGNHLVKLYNFVNPFYYHFNSKPKCSISKTLMNRATIVYLDDNCILDDINMSIDDIDRFQGFYNDGDSLLSSYIFVMSSRLYKRLEKLLYWHDLHCEVKIAIGVVTYENEQGLDWLEQNLSIACQHHKKYFKTYLDEPDLGTVKRLELK